MILNRRKAQNYNTASNSNNRVNQIRYRSESDCQKNQHNYHHWVCITSNSSFGMKSPCITSQWKIENHKQKGLQQRLQYESYYHDCYNIQNNCEPLLKTVSINLPILTLNRVVFLKFLSNCFSHLWKHQNLRRFLAFCGSGSWCVMQMQAEFTVIVVITNANAAKTLAYFSMNFFTTSHLLFYFLAIAVYHKRCAYARTCSEMPCFLQSNVKIRPIILSDQW